MSKFESIKSTVTSNEAKQTMKTIGKVIGGVLAIAAPAAIGYKVGRKSVTMEQSGELAKIMGNAAPLAGLQPTAQ